MNAASSKPLRVGLAQPPAEHRGAASRHAAGMGRRGNARNASAPMLSASTRSTATMLAARGSPSIAALLTDQRARPAEREHDLTAALGRRRHLRPARAQDQHAVGDLPGMQQRLAARERAHRRGARDASAAGASSADQKSSAPGCAAGAGGGERSRVATDANPSDDVLATRRIAWSAGRIHVPSQSQGDGPGRPARTSTGWSQSCTPRSPTTSPTC